MVTTPEIQLRDAKSGLSSVVDQAARGRPTVVTRHGERVAVVLGYADWLRLTGAQPSFAELLLAFPGMDEAERDGTPPRDLDS